MTTGILFRGAATFFLGTLVSCSGGNGEVYRDSAILMGTFAEVAVADRSEERARRCIAEALGEIRRVDALLSVQREESALSRLNRDAQVAPAAVDRELFAIVEQAAAFGAASGGAFDVTVLPLMRLWSFDDHAVVPGREEIRMALEKVGHEKLLLDQDRGSVGFGVPGMGLDLGAIGAGWAADRAVERLRALGVKNAIVDAGGEIRVLGTRPDGSPWRIGIRHPREQGALLMTLGLTDTAIATSGDYERWFERSGVRYHHILDPASGMPATGCRSVTVLAPTAAEADASSTAAFVLGPERGIAFLRSRPGVRGVIVDARGSLHWSDETLRRAVVR